jgi:hypothetical protein
MSATGYQTETPALRGHDWFHLVMGLVIGITPWLKGFAGGPAAKWIAIITALVVAALAVVALLRSLEWTQWGLAAAGVWTFVLPFILGLPPAAGNFKTLLIAGGLLLGSSLWKIYRMRNPE